MNQWTYFNETLILIGYKYTTDYPLESTGFKMAAINMNTKMAIIIFVKFTDIRVKFDVVLPETHP